MTNSKCRKKSSASDIRFSGCSRVGLAGWVRYVWWRMSPMVSPAAAEFLENYERDARVRWSPEDLSAQQAFVNAQLVGRHWLDLSTPEAALQLLQASQEHSSVGGA